MTVASPIGRTDYTGTGTTGPFPYTFKIFAATDLAVTVHDTTTGLDTALAYPGDYAVAGVGSREGGTITLTNALTSIQTLAIRRRLPLTQETELRNQGPYPPDAIERQFDRFTMIAQEQQDQLGRALKLPESFDPSAYDLQIPPLVPGMALVVNADGTGFDMGTLADATLAAWSASQNQKLDTFVVGTHFTAGVTTTLALTTPPGDVANVHIVRRTSGAAVPYLTDEFSVDTAGVVTFSAPIPTGTTRVEVRYFYTYQVNRVDSVNALFNAAGVGAVARSVRDKLRDVVHLRDYGCVGDGSDETAKINAALAAAGAQGGGIVEGDAGAVYGFSAQLTIPSKVRLRGKGRGVTTFRQRSGANTPICIAGAVGGVGQGVADLTLDCNRAQNTGAGQLFAIALDTATDGLIVGVEVKEHYGLTGSTAVMIAGRNVVNRCTVRDCYVHDCGDIGALHQADGIFFGGSFNKIVHNTIDNVTDTAIVCESATDPIIQGNVINNCTQGIAFGCAGTGPASGGSIVGNIVTGINRYNGQAILVYRFAGNPTSKVVVSGNIVRNTSAGAGIKIWQSSYVTVSGNVVSRVDGTLAVYGDGDGIIVRNCDHVSVIGNSSTSCGATGIRVDGCTNLTLSNNDVADNEVLGPGTGAGIVINNGPAEANSGPASIVTTGGIVIGNRSTGASQGRGLSLSGSCDGFVLMGNNTMGNANDPGYISAATGVVRLLGNQFSSVGGMDVSGGITISSGRLQTAPSSPTAGGASLGLTPGPTPLSGNNGDMWYEAATHRLYVIINGVSRVVTVT